MNFFFFLDVKIFFGEKIVFLFKKNFQTKKKSHQKHFYLLNKLFSSRILLVEEKNEVNSED